MLRLVTWKYCSFKELLNWIVVTFEAFVSIFVLVGGWNLNIDMDYMEVVSS